MRKDTRETLSDAERLEAILEILSSLKELAVDHVLVVEGKKDQAALVSLGISGDFFHMQSEGGPVNAAEYVENHGGKCVVLTDWDRRGKSLAD